MRKEYRRAVGKEFDARLIDEFPQFKLLKRHPQGFEQSRPYLYEPVDEFRYFVSLTPHRVQEWFSVEIGWYSNGMLPEIDMYATRNDLSARDGFHIQIQQLYEPAGTATWWQVEPNPTTQEAIRRMRELDFPEPEEYLPRVPGLVADAIAKIDSYAIPLFSRIAAEHNVEVMFGTTP